MNMRLKRFPIMAHRTGWYFQIPVGFFFPFYASIQKSIILQLIFFRVHFLYVWCRFEAGSFIKNIEQKKKQAKGASG